MIASVSASHVETDPLCNACIVVVNLTDYMIKEDNMTLQIVEEFVETLCELIGGGVIAKECDLVIDVIQDIFNLLDLGYTPRQICTFLKLCTPTQNKSNLSYLTKVIIKHKLSLNNHHNQNGNQQQNH
jgi:hypothetical protein